MTFLINMSARKKGFPDKEWQSFTNENPKLDPCVAIIKFKKLIKERAIKAGKKPPKWLNNNPDDDDYEEREFTSPPESDVGQATPSTVPEDMQKTPRESVEV